MEKIVEEDGVIKMPILKDKFAFPKSRRFSPVKVMNHRVSYTPRTSDFERVLKESPMRPRQPGMGGASARFDYYSSRRKQGALPSSASYNSAGFATKKGGKSFSGQTNSAYSFGVSRKNMQRVYIDEIIDPSAIKQVNSVGPGEHELSFEWSVPKDSLLNKTSP